MKTVKRIWLRFLFALLLTGSLSSCYILRQALPFLTHHLCAKPNEKLLADHRTDAEIVAFLQQVEEIRRFAQSELGLEETENYTKFYTLDREYLAAVVQAAGEFSVEPHLFKYPVLGRLPYKGFYNPEQAHKEAAKLRAQGLDVFIRRVDAFSSLGYFTDPLFSFMTGYSPARLAELIIHEQTHATIFIKDEPGFNEKLATFVGREGARQYVIARFGESSEEYAAMTASRHDSEQFTRDMLDLAHKLTALYSLDIPDKEKRRMKTQTIEQFQHEFAEEYEKRYAEEGYRRAAEMELNNAFLSLFRLYEEPDGRLERLLEKTGGIAQMMGRLRAEIEKSKAGPWEVVESVLAQ